MPGKKRGPGKPFVKGDPRAGRPAGSRNGAVVCKEWADSRGFDFLIRVADGTEMFEERKIDSKGKETVIKRNAYVSERTHVAQYLVDRAYGKPTAMIGADADLRLTLAQMVAASRKPKPIDVIASV